MTCKVQTKDKNLLIKKFIEATQSVCVYVRRGDYVGLGNMVCDKTYYHRAIDYIRQQIEKSQFYIFSDDIKWVKENIKIKDAIYVDNENSDYEELELMYNCKHFVMSNSTFSWWAQYLSSNEDKIVVAPSRWHPNDKGKRDLYMDS